MTTLANLRQLVWVQTETTPAELPEVTIDTYLNQAYQRTLNAEVQWPFYETSWNVTQLAGEWGFPLPIDIAPNGIMSLVDVFNQDIRLTMIDTEEAEDRFWGQPSGGTYYTNYSLWTNTVYLWPRIERDEDYSFRLRGFRLPKPFPVAPAEEPDMDARLHMGLAHYASALAYAQQEDMELENQYMKRWQNDVEIARDNIMQPSSHRPVIMGPSAAYMTPIGPGFRGARSPIRWSIRVPESP